MEHEYKSINSFTWPGWYAKLMQDIQMRGKKGDGTFYIPFVTWREPTVLEGEEKCQVAGLCYALLLTAGIGLDEFECLAAQLESDKLHWFTHAFTEEEDEMRSTSSLIQIEQGGFSPEPVALHVQVVRIVKLILSMFGIEDDYFIRMLHSGIFSLDEN